MDRSVTFYIFNPFCSNGVGTRKLQRRILESSSHKKPEENVKKNTMQLLHPYGFLGLEFFSRNWHFLRLRKHGSPSCFPYDL